VSPQQHLHQLSKKVGTLQVDVDELWVYYGSIGREVPAEVPFPVYQQGIPRLLDLFDRFGIRATFFICGRDLPAQASTVTEIARRGHELANHSSQHRNGFARLSRTEKCAEISDTSDLIHAASHQQPIGFKAPVFSFSPDLLDILRELGYQYDSSVLPTPYAPLMRVLQRRLSGGYVDSGHYGQAINGLAPLCPYQPDPVAPHRPARDVRIRQRAAERSESGNPTAVWEAPVTTMPILRLPMHSTFVMTVGQPLFDLGLALARARRVPINYLLHAADVIDAVSDPALASYKFLTLSWAAKRPLYEHILGALTTFYEIVPTCEYLARLRC
jgi:hypothetical protein